MFSRFADEWDYDYFKLDGQPDIPYFYTRYWDRLRCPQMAAQDEADLGPSAERAALDFTVPTAASV